MARDAGRGPTSSSASEGGTLVRTGFKSAHQPSLDLKNNPNDDAMRKIRQMRFPQGGTWSANVESALRKPAK